MAKEIPDLVCQERAGTGKGAARAARRAQMVPGIVFGGEKDPLPIQIPFNELLKKLKAGRFKSTLFNLKVDGHDDVRVICRDVQRDVVKDLPTHFDLMRLKRTSKVSLFVPVEFVNEDKSAYARKGGVLTVSRAEVELVVTASDIPESIVVDLEGRDIGDVLSISDVTLPKGAKPTIDRDFTIASISAPSKLLSEEEEAGEAEEAATEEAAEATEE